MLEIALLLGGPSEERGISLNSARSVADHITGDGVNLREVIYFDRRENAYSISRALLYSNTPSDFDFKLSGSARALTRAELLGRLAAVDLALPVIHGSFGEDGRLARLLEEAGVAYLGSTPAACAGAFDKYDAQVTLAAAGIGGVPSSLVTRASTAAETRAAVRGALRGGSAGGRAVVKPARGGSSIGVHVVADGNAADAALAELSKSHERIVVQPRMTGIEFTTIVLEGDDGPVALIPLEIELRNRRTGDEILDYRRKYLLSNDSRYHCPPRFDDSAVARIRTVAEDAFTALGLRDFARIDGWLDADGFVRVADINPISGMEQNSFLFIQAAGVGMTHRDVLRLLVARVARRAGVAVPTAAWRRPPADGRRPVAVLFGGDTAERQVSVLSGTNVWLKLLGSSRFAPTPYLLEGAPADGGPADGGPTVWRLPYACALRHSVEEISEACRRSLADDARRARLADDVVTRLGLADWQLGAHPAPPVRLTLAEFLATGDLVFNALHGGRGENGELAAVFDRHGIRYNGSGPEASATCADKYATGQVVAGMADPAIHTARRLLVATPTAPSADDVTRLWREAVEVCGTDHIVAKPSDDGCSAGVVPLASAAELARYLGGTLDGASRIDGGTFSLLDPEQVVELPTRPPAALLLEELIASDDVTVVDASWHDGEIGEPAHLAWGVTRDTGWVEVTVGVLGPRGAMRALWPSITIARKGVLSLEEKFMGGTGVNITPPPGPPVGRAAPAAVARARERIARVANQLGMAGYGRIDAFMHTDTGAVVIIEANALPGLTPATVLYHQGLAEDPPLIPRALLEHLLDLALSP
jgi:D-alanine--D-alanine ligase